MYSTSTLREALKNGSSKGFVLFPEIRDKENIKKIKSNPVTEKLLEELLACAKAAVYESSPSITFSVFTEYARSGNRLKYETSYFNRRKQLFSLVLAMLIEEDESYVAAIEEKLWEWCELYSWELPAHIPMSVEAIEESGKEPDEIVALFSAETAFYFAELLSVIGDKLNPLLVRRVKKEIFRRVINPYKNNTYGWEGARMNWSSVCAGSVGSAAMYLINDEEELCVIIQRILFSMEAFLEGFDNDGLITEGLSYWVYGFSFYIYFAELLKERTAGRIDLMQGNEKLRKIAELPLTLQFPAETVVTFSDAIPGKWGIEPGLIGKLQNIFGIREYIVSKETSLSSDHTFRWAHLSRNFFWGKDAVVKEDPEVKTGLIYYPESQWLIDRRMSSNLFTAFAAKGGHNNEPHNHNDLGHFILHHNGNDIFVDIGAPEYSKQYFSPKTRYDILAASSLGHSVPVINGKVQSYGRDYHAKVLRCEEKQDCTYFTLELGKAYDCPELLKYERSYVWKYSDAELIIIDDFTFVKPGGTVEERFITELAPKLVEPGKIALLNNSSRTELYYDKNLEYSVEKLIYKDHSGAEKFVYGICVSSQSNKEHVQLNFRIKIYPEV